MCAAQCVFRGNVFDSFLGSRFVVSVKLVNCVFDSRPLNEAMFVSFEMIACVEEARATELAVCATQSRVPVTQHTPAPTPSPKPVTATVKRNSYNSLLLSVGQSLTVKVVLHPIFAVFPNMTDLSASVYDSDGGLAGRFTIPTFVFAVYFSLAGGQIVFAAKAKTMLAHVTAFTSWICRSYVVSSSPNERWSEPNERELHNGQWARHLSVVCFRWCDVHQWNL
jgi:hypothetical protein